MEEENAALIAWFTNRSLPTGGFVISTYERTSDLASMVSHAIDGAHNGNTTSLAVLRRTKDKLEAEPPV
ncbi:hypothetical protein [Spirosoma rigui]|uniref:hypothetical protein n=1 Tax=Spirosoma rigui TaxID=564064 RepID=UPI0009B09622|nr:hypothetical protein [Spirosoma rigui]